MSEIDQSRDQVTDGLAEAAGTMSSVASVMATMARQLERISNRGTLLVAILMVTALAALVGVVGDGVLIWGVIPANHRTTLNTNAIVRAQIPGLQSQIAQRDKTISDQQYELNEAVAAIKQLAGILEAHHIQPPEVTINPPPNP
jgi:hypothetical protein